MRRGERVLFVPPARWFVDCKTGLRAISWWFCGRITRFSARKLIIHTFPREFLKWNLKNGVISPPRISLTPKRAPKPQLECQFFVRVGIWMNETRWWRKAMERSVTAGSDCSEIGGSEVVVTVIRILRGDFSCDTSDVQIHLAGNSKLPPFSKCKAYEVVAFPSKWKVSALPSRWLYDFWGDW